jgi:hypothetical protein
MADELGARERRYLEAYLELESQAATGSSRARQRVLAAAFGEDEGAEAEEEPWEVEVVPSRRSVRRGALVIAGLGLCAAAMVAWWAGRASLAEQPTARRSDQAPLVRQGDREVHEATAARRGAGASRTAAGDAAAGVGSQDVGVPTQTPTEGATLEPRPASADARSSLERRSSSARRPHEDPGVVEPVPAPVPATPTLSTAEVDLLDRARRLAQTGDHEAALARLREHVRRYPASVLATERLAEEVAVLCRMGAASAESARASFLAGDPPQYLRSRVAKACTP